MRDKTTATVSPLADALQMRLGIDQRKGADPKIVQLGAPLLRIYKPFSWVLIDVMPEIKASYKSDKQSAVLVQIKGDFHVYMSYHLASDELAAAVIDAGLYPLLPTILIELDGLHPKQAITKMAAGVKTVYRRKQYETVWRETHGIGGVDSRQGVSVDESTRATD